MVPLIKNVTVNGRDCRVYFSIQDGSALFVRVATLTKGDARGGWRTLNIKGPMARAAIAAASRA